MEQITEILVKLPDELVRPQARYTPEQLAEAQRKMQEKLARELGICEPYCPECGGIGYVRTGDGGMTMCSRVDRWKLPGSERIGISREEAETLDWQVMKLINPSIQEAIDAIQRILAWGFGWVYLHGPWGTGKTEILKIATAVALRQRKDAAYTRMSEILDHLRESFDEKSGESESARLDWWSQLPVLCIDEFDKLRQTPYGEERRFVLLDRRYEQAIRRETATIIASNEPPDRLPGYLADRVGDGRFFTVRIIGDSFRPGMDWVKDVPA